MFSKAVRRLVLLNCQQHVVYFFSLAFPNAQSLPQGPLPGENVMGPLPKGFTGGECAECNEARSWLCSVCMLAFSLPSLAFSLRLLA